jgi:16S rRNA (guanine527-N7)-methyltransferase
MEIASSDWEKLIIDGAGQLEVAVSRKQAAQMAVHGRELLAWNRRTNLTAITDPEVIAVKHFLDSLAGLNDIPAWARVLDIGCGGGFPGLPLKIMRPGQPIVLADSVRKKISFIKHIIRTLQLHQIEAVHARAEMLADREDCREGFDVVTCRALADMETIRRLAMPLLTPNGALVIYKGPQEQEGNGQGPSNPADIFHPREFKVVCRDFRLPFTEDGRRLYLVRRLA